MTFKLFRSSAEKELDSIIGEMKINLANNYKEPAHKAREKLGARTEALHAAGKLTDKQYRAYKALYDEYTQRLKDYHH